VEGKVRGGSGGKRWEGSEWDAGLAGAKDGADLSGVSKTARERLVRIVRGSKFQM